MDTLKALLETPRYAAASAAFDEIADAHSLYAGADGEGACKCGRTFRTNNGLGLHLGAIRREASRAFDGAVAR